jgi:hypothetical protein
MIREQIYSTPLFNVRNQFPRGGKKFRPVSLLAMKALTFQQVAFTHGKRHLL